MYENIIDWVALSEVIGVIPAALLKMAFIWLMPLLVLFGLYVIYSLVRREFYAKRLRKYLQISKMDGKARHYDSKYIPKYRI